MLEWLNYHHLLYFWTVAREGGLAPASERLRLSPQAISSQVKALEEALGEALFEKHGRRLVPTEMGRVVLDVVQLRKTRDWKLQSVGER